MKSIYFLSLFLISAFVNGMDLSEKKKFNYSAFLQQQFEQRKNEKVPTSEFNLAEYCGHTVDETCKSFFGAMVHSGGVDERILELQGVEPIKISSKNLLHPSCLEVKEISQRFGKGLFLSKDVQKGMVIVPYKGLLKVKDLRDKPGLKDFYFSLKESCPFTLVCDPGNNLAGFCNHSYVPNVAISPVRLSEKGPIFFALLALENMSAGTQLLWNYGPGYWESLGAVPEESNGIILFHKKEEVAVLFPLRLLERYFGQKVAASENDWCIKLEKNQDKILLYNDDTIWACKEKEILGADIVTDSSNESKFIVVFKQNDSDVAPRIDIFENREGKYLLPSKERQLQLLRMNDEKIANIYHKIIAAKK
ncbi:SET domain-containing protein [Candidatus Dependentiae bacterium]|nr:SET domain-containing protein [Candidatus Dependentiae bacterium]